MTRTLREAPWGAGVARILAAALAAVDPARAVAAHLRLAEGALVVGDRSHPLREGGRVWVVGAGKAGWPMAQAAGAILQDRVAGGLVIVKEGHAGHGRAPDPIEIVQAGHPLPDARGRRGARRMAALLEAVGEDDLVLVLISGGGSALLTLPAPGVSLEDLRALTEMLLASGAPIEEINLLRKHLDVVKGGGLARLAAPARVVTLILSDVVGSPLDVIASGPTVPDPGTYAQALELLQRYELLEKVPPPVRRYLDAGRRGDQPETPGPGDPLFDRVHNVLVADNPTAAGAACAQAEREGYHAHLLTTFLEGEARQAGRFLAAIARQIDLDGRPVPRPACVVAGGETTVTLQGDGLGGRNQELALGAVRDLAGVPRVALVTLATDGGDGPTDAAGAVVTGETLARARAEGLDPDGYLSRNDAYHFFQPLGDLLRPGPTRTNVNDLVFVFAF